MVERIQLNSEPELHAVGNGYANSHDVDADKLPVAHVASEIEPAPSKSPNVSTRHVQRHRPRPRNFSSKTLTQRLTHLADVTPVVITTVDLDDPELKQLGIEVNADHDAILAANASSMERALSAGARIDIIKIKIGHGNFRRAVKKLCSFKIATAQLYHRLFRRLTEMPDMRPKIINLTLNEADELLRKEREHRIYMEQLDRDAFDSNLSELVHEVAELVRIRKKRTPDQQWQQWSGPVADFVKAFTDLPYPLAFPAEFPLESEDDEVDMPDKEPVEYDEDEEDDD
jgi:hypothetical protein